MSKALEKKLEQLEKQIADLRATQSTPAKKITRPKEAPIDWTTIPKFCRACRKTKHVLPGFGLVNRRGVKGPQGRCASCRAGIDYHKMPRKYNTVNGGPGEDR